MPGKNPRLLPTPSLTPNNFEDFTERLLSAHRFCAEPLRRVTRVERWGRRGDKQDGIDFEGDFSDGKSAAWQCKRYDKLTVSDVRDAVNACTFTADEFYLVYSGEASRDVRDEIAKHPYWQLLDQRGLGRLLDDLPLHKGRDVVDATWGAQKRKLLLEMPGEDAFLSLDTFVADRQDRTACSTTSAHASAAKLSSPRWRRHWNDAATGRRSCSLPDPVGEARHDCLSRRSRSSSATVRAGGPSPCDQATVPTQDRPRRHEHPHSPRRRQPQRQRRDQHPVRPCQPWASYLPLQHGELVAQQEDLGLLRGIRTSRQRQPTDQATSDHVPQAQSHYADHASPADPRTRSSQAMSRVSGTHISGPGRAEESPGNPRHQGTRTAPPS
jgi:hypothetical protein